MSRKNVEVVRQLYDAVARHDTATVLALYDPEVVSDFSRSPIGDFMARSLYRGHEGVRRWFRERYEAWEWIEDDCAELIDAGEHVISVVTTRGRGRASGVQVELHHAGVWTVREGKIVRVVWLPSREEALKPPDCESHAARPIRSTTRASLGGTYRAADSSAEANQSWSVISVIDTSAEEPRAATDPDVRPRRRAGCRSGSGPALLRSLAPRVGS